ncbi:MAG: hypothetical protein K0S64_1435 [Gaiellaceae bacterium]|nr:hypothetical protein [Gaiellaceae bacterium]
MIVIVPNHDAMLAELRDTGVEVDEKTEDMESVGRFGWAADPEATVRGVGASDLAHEGRVVVEGIPQHRLLRGAHLVEPAHGPAVRRLLQQLR